MCIMTEAVVLTPCSPAADKPDEKEDEEPEGQEGEKGDEEKRRRKDEKEDEEPKGRKGEKEDEEPKGRKDEKGDKEKKRQKGKKEESKKDAEEEPQQELWATQGRQTSGELHDEEHIVVFTDGASRSNQHRHLRHAGLGAFWGSDHALNVSEALGGSQQTNNRAELMAVIRVLQLEARPLEVRTDSAYVMNGMIKHRFAWKASGWTKKGRQICNADLWAQADELAEQRAAPLKLTKVKGHASAEDVAEGRARGPDKYGNDAADALAVAGARSNRGMLETGRKQHKKILCNIALQRMMVEICVSRAKASAAQSDPSTTEQTRSSSSSGSSSSGSDSSSSSNSTDDSSTSTEESTEKKQKRPKKSTKTRGRSAPAAPE
jgi:ribonuclease HI